MRIVIAIAVLFSGISTAYGKNFRLYPGFLDPKAFVQMTNDKGLTVEITLRCERKGARPIAGIMVYSKIEKTYCSSKWLCTKDARIAANDTCGY